MSSIGIIILAAGGSSRMGSPKQLLPFRGRTLLDHAATAALDAGCGPVAVVLGAHSDQLNPQLDGLDVAVTFNSEWEQGMGGTIRIGLTRLLETHSGHLEAVILMLCDQPAVSSDVLQQLSVAYRSTDAPVVASAYGGTLVVPALFRADLFPELLALTGAEGARQILRRHRPEAVTVSFPEGTLDIDTAEDYAALIHSTTV